MVGTALTTVVLARLRIGKALAIVAVLAMGACASTEGEIARFRSQPGQELGERAGDSLITSRGQETVVSIHAASHWLPDRPEFIVEIQNVAQAPVDFRLSGVEVVQIVDGKARPLHVYTADDQVRRLSVQNIGASVWAGIRAGVADAMSAEGDTSEGDAIMAQNQQQKAAVAQQIRDSALADRLIPAGGAYSGKLQVEVPSIGKSGTREYIIKMRIGADQHEILAYHSKLRR